MKLTNPTDDQLNAAFAEHVAGWKWWRLPAEKPQSPLLSPTPDYSLLMHPASNPGRSWLEGKGVDVGKITGEADKFVHSADAVLPWLEKVQHFDHNWNAANKTHWIWVKAIGQPKVEAHDKCFPRAAVIALLRAHGSKVEFTQ